MKHYKAYLIDLDGTMYRGNQVIDEAPGFIQWLKREDIPFLFLTNNSSMTPERISQKLNDMGVACELENVYTTSMATAEYMSGMGASNRVFAIGEEGLMAALQEKGFELVEEKPDYVVVGIDRGITYEKMAKASLAIQHGAQFISTNPDRAVPTERGFVPGNGAITAAIALASGQEPQFIGKPESVFVDLALKRLGVTPDQVLLIGDNMRTDIEAGVRAGVHTLLVLTGITRQEDLPGFDIQPTYIVEHLQHWIEGQ